MNLERLYYFNNFIQLKNGIKIPPLIFSTHKYPPKSTQNSM